VELNPLRAKLTNRPSEYEWSSAASHLLGKDPHHTLDMAFWAESGGAQRWVDLLATDAEPSQIEVLRRATHASNPLGSSEFQEWVKEQRVRLGQSSTPARRGPAVQTLSANEKYVLAG